MNTETAPSTESSTGTTAGPETTVDPTTSTSTPTTTTIDPPTTTIEPETTTIDPPETTTIDPSTTTTTSTTGDTDTTGDSEGDTDTTGDPPVGEEFPVIECDASPLAPAEDGTCNVVSPGTSGTLIRGTVLAPDAVYENGAVLVDAAGVIACVGCDCLDLPAAADATTLACAEGVISPGLINPHDHITFANNKPIGEGVDRYEHRHDWRIGKNGHQKLTVPGSASNAVVLAAELRFVMSGATSIAGAGGKKGLLRNLDVGGMLEGLPLKIANSDTFPLGDTNGTQLANGCGYPDVTLTTAIDDENAYLPHISEGIDNYARNEFVCLSQGDTDVIDQQTAIIHAIGLKAKDMETIHPDKARVIWSPRSNVVLYGNTAQVTALDALGVPLALGTDWVASGSMNMLRELRCADELNTNYYDKHFSDADLWQMVTVNAALATGAEGGIGLLKPGYAGDIAVFDGSQHPRHSAVVRGELPGVALVLRGGQALYGDAALVEAVAGQACEALDVCGRAKQACVAETGQTLAQLKGAIDAIYPLFFCETPTNEPSCVPSRPGEYTGELKADDADGDGEADAEDNCPAVFNPPMLIDPGQADDDQDGLGDACDVCPTDPTDTCAMVSADDMDDDGVSNGADNCPRLANPAQDDADADGKGDACDTCPTPNPGLMSCPTTIEALRDPNHPDHAVVTAAGSVVTVVDVYVTGIRPSIGNSRGFHIETGSQEPYTGIFVFTGGTTAPVKIGDVVTVTGSYELYNGLHELVSPIVTVTGTGDPLPFEPLMVAPADVATNGPQATPLQSLLVTVAPVTLTSVNPDAPADYDEFSVSGGLRVDDQLSDAVQNMGLNNACPIGTTFDSITGVLSYSFMNSKLQPRVPTDLVLGAGNLCDPWP